ncbi:MAG: tRNA pseudouridine(55) synthase TruB [Luminiphilus sp.]|nr:tRNA pseudouridine(55) synthase TruB [Luminiphilus sp.]
MARRRRGRAVNGILILDKPLGLTSNAALQACKRLFDAAKAGHTGSLDPLATGVLPLCFGEATKFSQFVLDADKAYTSTFVLGVGTDTLDVEGEITARADASVINESTVRNAMSALTGDIEQVPPMYSALKRNGQPLYKLARQGVEVERASRRVTIREFECLAFRPGVAAEVDVAVHCSKGTYIRSLAEALGEKMGLPAHVSALRRTLAGPYALQESISLNRLEEVAAIGVGGLDDYLCPMDGPLQGLPAVSLVESSTFYLQRGQPVMVPNAPQNGILRLYAANQRFLGIGEVLDDGRVAPRRLVNDS